MHAALMLLGFVANALLAFFVLSRDSKALANRLYAVLTFLIAWWAIAKFALTYSANAAEARFWYQLSSFGWLPLPVLYLQFVGAYTRRRLFGAATKPVVVAAYVVAAVLCVCTWADGLIVERMVPAPWGFTHKPGPVYRVVFIPYLLGLFVCSLYHLIAYAVRATKRDERMGGILLVGGILLPLIGGGLTNMILPAVGVQAPELAIPLLTANALIVAFAVVRYRLLSLTVEFAARTIIKTMPDALLVLDEKGVIVLANPAITSLTLLSEREIVGKHFNAVCHGSPLNDDMRLRLENEALVRTEVQFVAWDGTNIPVALSISALHDRRGSIVGYVCVAKDIRELRDLIARIEAAKKELERIAITDPLTGTFNRRYLALRLREEFLRSTRYGVPFSVIVADLDHFKELNDTRGHSAGDELLRKVAEVFRRETRSCDVVTRYGGDEFVLVLPETAGAAAGEIADRLRRAVQRLPVPRGVPRPTASFGVAAFEPMAAPGSEEILLQWADAALYESKRLGRNRVTRWRAGGAAHA